MIINDTETTLGSPRIESHLESSLGASKSYLRRSFNAISTSRIQGALHRRMIAKQMDPTSKQSRPVSQAPETTSVELPSPRRHTDLTSRLCVPFRPHPAPSHGRFHHNISSITLLQPPSALTIAVKSGEFESPTQWHGCPLIKTALPSPHNLTQWR